MLKKLKQMATHSAINHGGLEEEEVILFRLNEAFELYSEKKFTEAQALILDSFAIHWLSFYRAAYVEDAGKFPELAAHYLVIAQGLQSLLARKGDSTVIAQGHLLQSGNAPAEPTTLTPQDKAVLQVARNRAAWHTIYRLGKYYEQSRDKTAQSKSAEFYGVGFHLCHQAAIRGSIEAMSDLGTIYLDGIGGCAKDLHVAVKWLTPPAESNGLPAFTLSKAYKALGDRAQQQFYLEKAYRISPPQCAVYGELRIELAKFYIYAQKPDFNHSMDLLEEVLQNADEEESEKVQAKCWLALLYTATGTQNSTAGAYFQQLPVATRQSARKMLQSDTADTPSIQETKIQLLAAFDQLDGNHPTQAPTCLAWTSYTDEDVELFGIETTKSLLGSGATSSYMGIPKSSN